MSVGARIKEARLRKGWSQSQLARSVGVKPQSVQQWEADEAAPNRKRIDVVAAVLDARPEELLFGTEGEQLPDTQIGTVIFPFGYKIVPVLSYSQAAEWTASQDPYRITERMENIWTNVNPLSERAFALNIQGDSMREEFLAGDIVILDPEVAPRPGDFVAVGIEHQKQVLFRKYRLRGTDSAGNLVVELAPLNDDYPTFIIDSSHVGRIVATLVEHRKYRRRDRSTPSLATEAGGATKA
ncbi:MAG: LexA family protein [Gammaproteobacteria bacterium]